MSDSPTPRVQRTHPGGKPYSPPQPVHSQQPYREQGAHASPWEHPVSRWSDQQREAVAQTRPNFWRFRDHAGQTVGYPNRESEQPVRHDIARFHPATMVIVAMCTALGLASIQVANQRAFHGANYGTALIFFWTGLGLIFLPITLCLIMRGTARAERIALVLLLGAAFYVVKIEGSPYTFTFNDEYIHLVNTYHILDTHRLFQYNSLLPTAAYYEGLAALNASLVNLTGLSTFVSGLIIIGVGRVIISACFFLVAEKVTGSARAAGVASLVYAANPMFMFWSSTFSYEDLGLPLAFFGVWWLSRTRNTGVRTSQLITATAICAVIVTHHISAFALAGILVIWFLTERITRKPREQRRFVGIFAVLAGAASALWFFLVARPASGYLIGQNIAPALKQAKSLLTGHAGRQLYGGGGYAPPSWYVLVSFAAVGAILIALMPTLYSAWSTLLVRFKTKVLYKQVPLIVASVIAISYPFTLLPRFTADGGPVSARTSEYVFTGVGCILGLLAVEPVISRHASSNRLSRALNSALGGWRGMLALISLLTLVFVGQIAIGNTYFQLLPPSTTAPGFPWIPQPDVISASNWARTHLGRNQSFATNFVDSLALATYGDETVEPVDDIFPIFFGNSLAGLPAEMIRDSGTRYILVDWRMTQGRPSNPGDFYFSQWEPGAGSDTKPFPAAYLKKFSTYSCSRMIYADGSIQIFDVSAIANGTCTPKLVIHKQGSLHKKA
jgi:hypothetical protein